VSTFGHEHTAAYRSALALLESCARVHSQLGFEAPIAEELEETSTALVIETAKLGSSASIDEAREHRHVARAKCGRLAAALDVIRVRRDASPKLLRHAREHLDRLVSDLSTN